MHRTRRLLLSWWGSGYSPWAPGTAGSIATLPFAVLAAYIAGSTGVLVLALAAFVVGLWAANSELGESGSDMKDPQWIVIDETAGQALALVAVPLDWTWYLMGFAAFRLFDVWKPGPIGWVDRHVAGGLGIMLDDVVAGICAAVVLAIIRFFVLPIL